MSTAKNLSDLLDKTHIGMGFMPIDGVIDAGYVWEAAQFINSQSAGEARFDFWDNRVYELSMHIDKLALMLGTKVVDADNTYVVFADGSALAANSWGQTFVHPIENYTPNRDYGFID